MKYVIFGCILIALGISAWMHESPLERLNSQSTSTKESENNLLEAPHSDWVNVEKQSKNVDDRSAILKEANFSKVVPKSIVKLMNNVSDSVLQKQTLMSIKSD